MMRSFLNGGLILAGVHMAPVQATLSWIRAGATQTCAAIKQPCTGLDCTQVAVGPCTDPAVGAPFYLSTEYVGLAFIGNESTYMTDTSQVKVIESYSHANNGYRDFNDNVSAGAGAKYAYVMTGMHVGDPAVAGAYVGTASFIMKEGTASTNKNEFYYAENPGAARVDRSSSGGSEYGAPNGPVEVCIAPKSGNSCGSAISYSAGDYKFSLYGVTKGSSYAANTQAGQNGFPSSVNYLGIRMKLTATNLTNLRAAFNAAKIPLSELNCTDVSSLTIGSDQGTISMTFPTQYNVGTTNALVPDATKNVKIKASEASANSLYIDYLFDASDFNDSGVYFVYDPTTTATNSPAPQPISASVVTTSVANVSTTASVSSACTYSFASLLLVSLFSFLIVAKF